MVIAPSPPLGRHGTLRASVTCDSASAERLRSEWLDLLSRSAVGDNGLSLTPDWLLTWWREFGDLGGRQLRLVAIRRDDTLVGLAPLTLRRIWRLPGVPFRRLEFLATGEPPADAIYSEYLGVIAERGLEAEVAQALAAAIAHGELGRFDEIVLSMMSGDDPSVRLLADAFRDAGLSVEQRPLAEAPYATLPATWDDYLTSLSGNGRRLAKTSLKAFDDWAAGTTRLEQVSRPEDLDAAKQVLVRLHHDRWHGRGTFHSPRFLRFHDAMMRSLLADGALQLFVLHAHDRPVAALYDVVWNGKVYFYQSGRCSDAPDRIRPGIVVLLMAIRQAIEERRREFDFLAGAATYKTQLGRKSRSLVELRAARPSFRERLRLLAERGVDVLRRVKRSLKRKRGTGQSGASLEESRTSEEMRKTN